MRLALIFSEICLGARLGVGNGGVVELVGDFSDLAHWGSDRDATFARTGIDLSGQ